MSLQILSQYAGGPRVRATGRPAVTTSGSGAVSESDQAPAAVDEVAGGGKTAAPVDEAATPAVPDTDAPADEAPAQQPTPRT
ncbi:hypothetical protein G6025_05525, partial [Dietzia natronolimnaea]|nr:hypothetical protein [Dietzia natronolimnaea]